MLMVRSSSLVRAIRLLPSVRKNEDMVVENEPVDDAEDSRAARLSSSAIPTSEVLADKTDKIDGSSISIASRPIDPGATPFATSVNPAGNSELQGEYVGYYLKDASLEQTTEEDNA